MDMLTVAIALGVLGLALGSFVGAQVWRLRARQLVDDKAAGEPYSAKEYAKLHSLTTHHGLEDRSRCLSCGHVLAWYDLIPLVSWLSTGGRCSYCRKPIGWMEPLVELGVAAAFILSYLFWPFDLTSGLEWVRFGVWLIACVLMAIMFVYDAKWSLLPFAINIALIVTGGVFLVLTLFVGPFDLAQWGSLLGAIAILAGLYFLFSLAGWVGLGDSILGLGLALLLMRWEYAFLALFMANLLGSLTIIPLAAQRRLQRGTHVPFGPFLILGACIAFLWGSSIIATIFDWSGGLMNTLMV
jgi:leader peptidase (prepilin peptidase)/N-methyltransferase